MTEFVNKPEHALYTNLTSLLAERLSSAYVIETLSDTDGKILAVMEEGDRKKFIRRQYSSEGLETIEAHTSASFDEAWWYYQDIFQNADIATVPSFVIEDDAGNWPITVVSEHLEPCMEIASIPTEAKVELVKRIPKLIAKAGDTRFLHPISIMPDMFHATFRNGEIEVFLTDIDPYSLRNRIHTPNYDIEIATLQMKNFSDMMYEYWCNSSEREKVLGAFEVAIHEEFKDEIEENIDMLMELSRIHELKFGFKRG